jgi:hypothetical protein
MKIDAHLVAMIIWTGWGFLVALIVFACALVTNLIADSRTGGDAYWNAHKWPMGVALLVAAILCWFIGLAFHDRKPRVLIDAETGKEVVFRKSHSLFFIPVRWWGPILGILALICFVLEILK